MGAGVINSTIIPMLCAEAGVPLEDSRGHTTSHRGRASAVTALVSVPQGMSMIELMQWWAQIASLDLALHSDPTNQAGCLFCQGRSDVPSDFGTY
jgi:hypothetical protein